MSMSITMFLMISALCLVMGPYMIFSALADEDWGFDEYGRYRLDWDGERYQIEAYPFHDLTLGCLRNRCLFRIDIMRWYLHHGYKHRTRQCCPECGWKYYATHDDEPTCTCLESIYED
jgi:hypothetical protein